MERMLLFAIFVLGLVGMAVGTWSTFGLGPAVMVTGAAAALVTYGELTS